VGGGSGAAGRSDWRPAIARRAAIAGTLAAERAEACSTVRAVRSAQQPAAAKQLCGTLRAYENTPTWSEQREAENAPLNPV